MALAADSMFNSHVSASSEVARVNAMTEMVSGLLVTYLPPLVTALQNDKELTDLLERLDKKLDLILEGDDKTDTKSKYDGNVPFNTKTNEGKPNTPRYDGRVPFKNEEKSQEKRGRGSYMGRAPFADAEQEPEKRKYMGNNPFANTEKDAEKRRDQHYMGPRPPFVEGGSDKDVEKKSYDGNVPYVYENERTLDDGKSYDHENEPLTETEKQKEERVLRQMLEILVRKRDHDIPFPLVGYKRDQQ